MTPILFLVDWRKGDLSFHEKKEKKVRFTCIDVFSRKHVLEARFDEYFNVKLLMELLDIAKS